MKGRVRDRGACSYKQADRSKGSSALLSSDVAGSRRFKVQGSRVQGKTRYEYRSFKTFNPPDRVRGPFKSSANGIKDSLWRRKGSGVILAIWDRKQQFTLENTKYHAYPNNASNAIDPE